jgi:3-dehydro-L-gulonate 2-dehydrogenase
MMAAMLSAGHATHQIPTDKLRETGLSQVFLAFDVSAFGLADSSAESTEQIVEFVQAATRTSGGENIRYPGERTLQTRAENRSLGIPVEPALWDEIQKM